ncbi:hypothetical protein [Cellvibrio mixtus]|nr:hypothetical protein [Cellvibrio mixtus]
MTALVDGQQLTAAVNSIEREYLDGFKPQATVVEPVNYAVDMESTFTFSIHCTTDNGYSAGQSATDSYSLSDCSRKINHFITEATSGLNPKINEALKHDVKTQPLYTYNNPRNYASVLHNYCEACNNCSGRGCNTCRSCTNGYNSCYHCSSGYSSCYSCSGSGYRWENNRQISCNQCSGGRVRCHYCSGSGRTTCSNCNGRGEINCNPCSATGYLTYWMSATASSSTKQTCKWNPGQAPDWLDDYLTVALAGKAHIPVNRAVPWRFAEAHYQVEHLPFTVNVNGVLKAADANIAIGDYTAKGLFLVPDKIEVWSLNNVLDKSAYNISDFVENNFTNELLKKYLNTRLSKYALESVNKQSLLPRPIASATLLSDSGFNKVKATIIESAKKYDKARRFISPKRWLVESLLCSVVIMAVLSGLNFMLPAGNSSGLGIAHFVKDIPTILGHWHLNLMRGEGLRGAVLIPILMLPTLAFMTLLGSGRAWSRLRLTYWFVASVLLIAGIIAQTNILFKGTTPANWWSFSLIPDVILCGALAGLLRARRYVYKNIGKEVKKLESDAFARMLNYKE